jgi:cyclopropane-fatty-acyl-phospholipid synthase
MKVIDEILKSAKVEINGPNPWDPQLKDKSIVDKIVAGGSLALAETYIEKKWDVEDLEEMFFRITRYSKVDSFVKIKMFFTHLKNRLLNLQSRSRAFMVGVEHYDLDNTLYQKMLDKRMIYTAAYWKDAQTLDQAQENKLKLICEKLKLKKGDRVLDIGCGWGGFMKYAVENYGVSCVGLTVSVEQAKLAKEICKGLPIEFVVADYRDYKDEKKFDHIVSIEMFEAVGPKNFRTYFNKVSELLKDDGLFLLQTIGHTETTAAPDPFIEKYIFPNGILPSFKQISESIEKNWLYKSLFVIEDVHNIGVDYVKTLECWWENFKNNYEEIKKEGEKIGKKYDEKFYRIWKYYLLYCAAIFKSRRIHDWQIVLSKKGVLGGYKSVR